ncbi:hypothetical protein [Herbaspirillum sp. ST 5-3]|uniref:hypothetical protein n=1 Tax=Oxalobacteraceae TaxID=75682 RepID=UPI0010A3946B|nr:hypothetical protein [Herbaspirillum sp. ST 5-3]
MKKRFIVLVALALSANVLASPVAGDSTSPNFARINQAMQQRSSTGSNGVSHAVAIPNQTVYITQPTQTTYVTQNGTVQCSSYQTVNEMRYRYATTTEMKTWSSCYANNTSSMPAGTVRNFQSSDCTVYGWSIPYYVSYQVCAG